MSHKRTVRKPKHPGNEWQTYGWDAQGVVTHAGPVFAHRITRRVAIRIQRKWLRWRAEYLRDNPGNYPTRADADNPLRRTVTIGIYPIGLPERCRYFRIA